MLLHGDYRTLEQRNLDLRIAATDARPFIGQMNSKPARMPLRRDTRNRRRIFGESQLTG